MLRRATPFLVLLLLLASPATAQERVTIDAINQLEQSALDSLQSGGADLSASTIESLLQETQYADSTVVFTAVIMSDPYKSGLATFDEDTDGDGTADAPSRIHVFVRDTSAVRQGKGGMDLQLVESAGDDAYSKLIGAEVGDVYNIRGTVTYFGRTIQFDASALQFLGTREDVGLPASLMEPVTITTSEANKMLNEEVQFNWQNFSDLNNQYVRFERASILDRTIDDDGRPSWIFTTDDGDTYVENYDHSLRYRNDKDAYESPFKVREEPFRPPAPASVVNVQGFLNVNTDFEAFQNEFGAVPNGAAFHLSPFADSDLEVLEQPTVRNVTVSSPDSIPEASETITINVDANEGTVSDVNLRYVSPINATDTTTVEATSTGDGAYEATIDGIEDGDFVQYFAQVTDTNGDEFTSLTSTYRYLADGIDEIADLQTTASGGDGPSPFAGDTLTTDITATVQTNPDSTSLLAIQDDDSDTPATWSGVLMQIGQTARSLRPGDQITITSAGIQENFGLTRLVDVDYNETGSGDPIPYKTLTTSALQDPVLAEQHEGMLLRFNDVTIADTNPDAPDDFGEFTFTTGDDADDLRADDASDAVPDTLNAQLSEGQELDYIQGVWSYAFGNYKLLPEFVSDVGGISLPAQEVPGTPGELALHPNYPNPFSDATTIRYTLKKAGDVRLTVYDLLGRRVATLADERQPAGLQQMTFRAENLPSGLYFLRLKAGSETRTRKMTIVR